MSKLIVILYLLIYFFSYFVDKLFKSMLLKYYLVLLVRIALAN